LETNMRTLRDYINLVESHQLDEMGGGGAAAAQADTGPIYNPRVAGFNSPANQAKLAAAKAPAQGATPAAPPAPTFAQDVAARKQAQNLAASGKRPSPAPTQGATPTAPAAPATGAKPEAWVKELQDKLNAAGEKLKPDGVMGPATRAAQQRHPEVTTQPDAAQAVAADINKGETGPSAPVGDVDIGFGANNYAPQAPAATPWDGKDPAKAAAWSKLSPEDQKWLGMADPTDPYILQRAPNKGAAATGATPAPVAEHVTFGSDQALARIVELARRK
jgi:hypothetical protein